MVFTQPLSQQSRHFGSMLDNNDSTHTSLLGRQLSSIAHTLRASLSLENRSEKDRLPAAQHLADCALHSASHFLTNNAHDFGIVGSLGRITIFDMQRLEELRVPLRR